MQVGFLVIKFDKKIDSDSRILDFIEFKFAFTFFCSKLYQGVHKVINSDSLKSDFIEFAITFFVQIFTRIRQLFRRKFYQDASLREAFARRVAGEPSRL